MELSMPNSVDSRAPAQPYRPTRYVYDNIPGLAVLLPKWRGRPGFQYFQCCVVNLRRAQDEGWVEVEGTVIYTIEGPKGSVDMKLLARGKPIPGQAPNSGARLCYCDKTVEELTGLWINPNRHPDSEPQPEPSGSEEAPGDPSTLLSAKKEGEGVTSDSTVEPAVFRSGGGPSAAE